MSGITKQLLTLVAVMLPSCSVLPQVTAQASGQDNPSVHSKLLASFLADEKLFWSRPLRAQASDITWFVPFIATTSLLIGSDTSIEKKLSTSGSVLQRSEDLSNLGTVSLIGTAGALYLWGKLSHRQHWQETGLLGGEALLDSTFNDELMKLAFGRERPLQGDGKGNFWSGGTSFPSEHAAVAWSITSVFTHEYPGPLTQLLAYGTASGVSISRITARKHFASDVFIGSAMGWYMGRQVYRAHHEPELGGASWDDPAQPHETNSRNPKNMSSPYVLLDSWVYPALQRLAALGYVPGAFLGMRPWTRMECARLIGEAGEQIRTKGSEDSQAIQLYTALANEFAPEAARLDGAANRGASLDSVYLRTMGIAGTPLRDGYHFGQTLINDYGRPYGEGTNAISGLTAHAVAGPLSISVQGEYQHAPAVASDPLSVLQAIAFVDGTHPLPDGAPEIDRLRLLNSTIALTMRNVQISIGKQSLWLGPSEAGPFLFSNNAEPVTMLRFDATSPYEMPLISRLLGPVRSEFFLGRLSGQTWEYSPVLFGPNLTSQPFIHGTKVSFHPTPNLEFGMGLTAQFGGEGNPFTWSNFLRTFYSHRVGTGRNPGKRLSEFDFSYRLPGLRNWLQVYVDSMVIDEYSPLGSDRPGINPGIYLSRLPKIHRTDLRLEGITTDLNVPQHFGPGAFYWDNRYRSGYTNNGSLLGSWIGRRGRGEQAWLTYHFSPRSDLQIGYRHNNVDPAFLRGGTLRDLVARTDFKITDELAFSGFIQQENWKFVTLSSLPKSDLTASVELTFWPRRIKK
ncbi:MAG TPA: capsule assembly Wzi family protein [Terriglobales bacterium]|nr:capsule assembly Wzi family protein [Terriglobales bacterium]